MMCNKCHTVSGVLLLVLGLLFLVVDLGTWTFWGINWWTAMFLVWGVVKLASSMCKDCKALNSCCVASPAPKAKKR